MVLQIRALEETIVAHLKINVERMKAIAILMMIVRAASSVVKTIVTDQVLMTGTIVVFRQVTTTKTTEHITANLFLKRELRLLWL